MRSNVKYPTTAEYQALLAELPILCPNATFTVAGQSYTTAQVVALITPLLSASSAIPVAKQVWQKAITSLAAAQVSNGTAVKGVRALLSIMFEDSPDKLVQLGITPRKTPKPLSTAARAAAKAKAEATRKARGTTSKKQKAAITGNVTGVTITPLTLPTAASSPAPTPPSAAAPLAPTGSSQHS